MKYRIRDFADRSPRLSAVIIFCLFTVIPTAFSILADIFSQGSLNSPMIIFLFALAVEFILWNCVERPILVFMPFLISLVGLILAEIVYSVSLGVAGPGGGPSATAFWLSSVMTVVFGAEAAAFVGSLALFGLEKIIVKIVDFIRER